MFSYLRVLIDLLESLDIHKTKRKQIDDTGRNKSNGLVHKMPKWLNLTSFWKRKACGQTVLPDMSSLKGQKLVENAKIEKLKWDILDHDFRFTL